MTSLLQDFEPDAVGACARANGDVVGVCARANDQAVGACARANGDMVGAYARASKNGRPDGKPSASGLT
jgi:hypothetical protein